MDLTIRRFEAGDRGGWLDLHEDVVGHQLPGAVFDWKYDQPSATTPRIVVVEAEDDVVGAAGEIRVPLSLDGTTVTARHPTNVMVREDHRSGRLFDRLMTALRETFEADGVAVEFGAPTPEMRPIWESLQHWSFDRLQVDYRLQSLEAALASDAGGRDVVAEAAALADSPFRLSLRFLDALPSRTGPDFDVERCEGFRKNAFARTRGDAPVAMDLNADFWKWRTADPRFDGRTYWVSVDGAPIAAVYAVTRPTPRAGWEVVFQRGDARSNPQALLAIYRELLSDARDAAWVRAPISIGGSVATLAGLTHTRWLRAASRTRLGDRVADRVGLDTETIATRLVGHRWFPDELPADTTTPPPSTWEFNKLLIT